VTRERRILKFHSPAIIWKGKSLKEMTDEDCIDCLRFIRDTVGLIYVDPM
jgi:hypothetical protein